MPRQGSFVSAMQKLVREQVQQAIQGLLASTNPKRKAKNGRRGRRRRRGPGRPPDSKTRKRRA